MKNVDEALLLLALLPNNLSIYATEKDEERFLLFCLFVACSPDSEAADRLQDSLSLSCKFVCLRAQKLGKSFLFKELVGGMNPWELSSSLRELLV